jgi:uncharacterized protein YidB (DUF937 family)
MSGVAASIEALELCVGDLLNRRTRQQQGVCVVGLLDILGGLQGNQRGAPGSTSGGGMSPIMMALLGLLAYKALRGGSQTQGAPNAPAEQGGSLGDLLGGILGGGAAGGRGAGQAGGGGSLGDLLGGILGGQAGGHGAGPAGGGSLGDLLGGILGGQAPGGAAPGGAPAGGGSPAGGGNLGDLLGPAAGGVLGNLLNGGLRNLVRDMQVNGHGREVQSWVGNGPNEDISENDLANAIGADDIDHLAQQTGIPRDQLLSELRQYLPGAIDKMTPQGQLPSDEESSRWV